MERKFKWISGGISLAVIAISVMAFTTLAHSDESCNYCGMSKAKFGHSWVVIENEKGTKGVCSIHCAAIDMALNIDNSIKKMTVGDYNTKNQIDADKAYWVIGGDKGGVMTMRAKWAFQTKDAADAFIKAHGGKPAIFDDVMKAAFEDMYADTLMIHKKRQMMKKTD